MVWIIGSSLTMIIALTVCFITDKWTNKHSGYSQMYNFMYSVWEKSITVSVSSVLVFAAVMIVLIFSRIGVDGEVRNTRLEHDALVREYEMLNSDCEDISKIEVIDKITEWNQRVTWKKYWADNIWTNWFHPKEVTEAYEYIELD